MTWVRFEPNYPTHPKIAGLSDKAFRAHVKWICWCNEHLTDGRVPKKLLAKRLARELVDAGLLEDVGDEWQLHDFFDYQPSKAQVEAQREAKAEAGRRGGQRSGESRRKRRGSKREAPASAEPKHMLQQNRSKCSSKREAKPKPDPDPDPQDSKPTESPPVTVRSERPARARPRDPLRGTFDPAGEDPAVLEVFEAWKRICSKPNARLDPNDKRAVVIRDRLSEGLTLDDFETVFRAALVDPWARKVGLKLSVLLDNRERFEGYLEAGRKLADDGDLKAQRAKVLAELRKAEGA